MAVEAAHLFVPLDSQDKLHIYQVTSVSSISEHGGEKPLIISICSQIGYKASSVWEPMR